MAGGDVVHRELRPDVKKVYLINQDYSFGQSVQHFAR